MTEIKGRPESPVDKHQPHENSSTVSANDMFDLLLPLLAAAATTTLLATVAVLYGWHSEQMLAIDIVAGVILLLMLVVIATLRFVMKRDTAQALLVASERLASVVETAMDAIITMDESHTVVLFNKAAENVFGRKRDSVIGGKLDILLPERFRKNHFHHVARFGTTNTTNRRMGDQTVLLGLRANGEEFPIEASISQQGGPGHKLYTVILRDVTERVEYERALRHSREELRELAAVSQASREQERARVARELHDEVGGALTALKMDTAWILERIDRSESVLANKLGTMQKMLDNTVAATRRMSSDLRPMMLDDLGLVPAVEWLVHEFEQRTGVACELAFAAPDFAIPEEQATATFRILQESLTNITKHAGATQVEVTLEIEDGTLILTVRDNGRGFDTAGPRAPRSFGLLGMRERALLLGGDVRVESAPGESTILEARIPLAATGTPP